MILVLLSTPTWAFIPKYHWLPFLVWCISGSRCCSRFLVDVGACRMVASTIVPVVMRTPRACKCRLTVPRIFSPSRCSSSKCRNLHTVVSSGAGSSPKSIPTNCRITGESYRASSTAGSDRLNHCCRNKSAASAPLPPAGAHSPPWDNGVRLPRILLATGQLVTFLLEIPVVVSFLCTAQNHSSSPDSSVVCSSISSGAPYSIFLWKGRPYSDSP